MSSVREYRLVQAGVMLWLAAWLPTDILFGGDDRTPPVLKSLAFTPEEIQTSTDLAYVTISFAATDDSSGVNYFEACFTDPTGVVQRSATAKVTPQRSLMDSVKITFPRFSNAGTWVLSHVSLSDAAGNTLSLNAAALLRAGFPTRLEVRSLKDTVSPKLMSLDFTPAEIDTTNGPTEVKVSYTATDDLSGVTYIELSFASPSGILRRSASAKFEPTLSKSDMMIVVFPKFSEAGRWTLNSVFLTDAGGNTLLLKTERIADLGFGTVLDVKSRADTTSPELRSLRFSPSVIDTRESEDSVTVDFELSDDLSGVKSFEAAFTGPSKSVSYKGIVSFSMPTKEATGRVKVTFPKSSEPGTWSLSTVSITDDSGNSLVLDKDSLASRVVTNLQIR